MTNTPARHKKNQGFALLLSIIIASVVLAIGVSIMKISVSQLLLSTTARESEIAFQAAQSMSECLYYWRYAERDSFIARPGSMPAGTRLNAPPLDCMGVPSEEAYAQVISNAADQHIVQFHYQFDWGTDPQLCSTGDMYVMVPVEGDMSHTFTGLSVGDNGDGLKDCPDGSICTALVTQGYNRPCDELESSIFTVQRELTTEF